MKLGSKFVGCSDKVAAALGPDVMKTVKPLIPDLLAALPVLLYQGRIPSTAYTVLSIVESMCEFVKTTCKHVGSDSTLTSKGELACIGFACSTLWEGACTCHTRCCVVKAPCSLYNYVHLHKVSAKSAPQIDEPLQ